MLSASAAAIALLCFGTLIGGFWLLAFVLAVGAGYFFEAVAVTAFIATFLVAGWRAETRWQRAAREAHDDQVD